MALLVAACLAAGHAPDARAQEAAPSEYQVKAAFLYNFAKFVEWPTEAFQDATSPFVIGVLGNDPFEGALDQTVRGKKVNGRAMAVRRLKEEALGGCHILFISASEKRPLWQILGCLKGSSVLTVGEMESFTQAGGIVNFVMKEGRVRFEINADGAERARLRVSSKLLALAKVVRDGKIGKD
ncbi:MAG: hypothetical protein A3F84_18365 [Candidatus Handelsmanbacteria bacterium RIFCSPLOWO2_12_FULL_64_10]|uniref:DUF4154 domain-containing protein n=1 Tax=Handelsmanbacteria sp. (strain RIFCSPLOWO2_12_FULL_64_10) TaxID=1817868 RepID=A0A1F6CSD8_HANXR|nr:MAG: hypothetical protein A3F84_18365 [Candidatus Handelsmanbacteria bacterium RIFCSPLOWO2_12_FULL_64_10]